MAGVGGSSISGGIVFRCPETEEEEGLSVPRNVLLHDYVLQHAQRWSGRPAVTDGASGRSFTFGQVAVLVNNVAAGLHNLGVRRGDVVMLLLPNCADYIILFLGIVRSGAIVTTANPNYTAVELAKQAADSNTKLVITIPELQERTAEMTPPPQVLLLTDQPHSLNTPTVASVLYGADGRSTAPLVDVCCSSVCVLPYSSGTTGVAKGVMLTHHSLIANMVQMGEGKNPRFHLTHDDSVLGLLPMFHIYAITCINLQSLRMGARVVTMPRFDMEAMLGLIQRERLTVAYLVPPVILAITKLAVVDKYDLSSLSKVVSGAAPLDAKLESAFEAKMPGCAIGQGYGMTESSPVLTLSRIYGEKRKVCDGQRSKLRKKAGSAGVLLPLTEAKVVDTVTGRSLGLGERGEVWARGPQVMKGYLNNAAATAATVDEQGWLHTGDVGYFDDDGELFIVDRVKELIKFKGFQVPPAELEGLLLSHPAVADVAVVPKVDAEAGEVPVAFVVLRPAADASKEELCAFVAKQVAPYKRLHGVHFVDIIPKSASGKVLRRELRAKL